MKIVLCLLLTLFWSSSTLTDELSDKKYDELYLTCNLPPSKVIKVMIVRIPWQYEEKKWRYPIVKTNIIVRKSSDKVFKVYWIEETTKKIFCHEADKNQGFVVLVTDSTLINIFVPSDDLTVVTAELNKPPEDSQ